VARELTDIIAWRGKPGLIVSDNVLGRKQGRKTASKSRCTDCDRR
jgi:putative transposase